MTTYCTEQKFGPMLLVREKTLPFTLQVGYSNPSAPSGGPSSDPKAGQVSVVTAQSVSLYKAVTDTGVYVDPASLSSLSKYVGITLQAANAAETINVQRIGILDEPTWTWNVDAPIFIGANGTLTQNVTSPNIRRIGWASSATRILLDPYPNIGV